MKATPAIRAMLASSGKTQGELANLPGLGLGSRQAVNVRFFRKNWSVNRLIKIATYCGYKVILVKGDTQITLDEEE